MLESNLKKVAEDALRNKLEELTEEAKANFDAEFVEVEEWLNYEMEAILKDLDGKLTNSKWITKTYEKNEIIEAVLRNIAGTYK